MPEYRITNEIIFRGKCAFDINGARVYVDTENLYKREEAAIGAIKHIMEWREKHLGENLWKDACPSTLLALLENFEPGAAYCAAQAFVEKYERSSRKEEVA